MTLKQLEYFLAIAETGNITKAALNLNISQPPLSIQLKALEDEFGVLLFNRDKKNLVITDKGLLFQARAKQILSLVNETIYDLQETSPTPKILIKIGTISSVCHTILPKKILQYQKTHPNVSFEIYEGSTTAIEQQLADGIVELGIIREPFNTSLYHSCPIRLVANEEEHCDYFAAIGQPDFFTHSTENHMPLIDLKNKPLIIHRRYQEVLTYHCRQQGFVPKIICQNNDIFSSLCWAAEGIGVAIAPLTSASQNKNPNLVIKKIVEPAISSQAHLVWTTHISVTKELENFICLFK